MAEPIMSLEAMVAAINERTRLMLDEQRATRRALEDHIRDDKALEARVRKNERFRAAVAALGVFGTTAGGWSVWKLFS